MPIKKFKTFEEAEMDLWCFEPDEAYFERIRKMFEVATKLHNKKYKPGLYKYKTFKEAQDELMRWHLGK